MGQQKLSIETSNNTLTVGEQITVDIFHEVERESTESGAFKLGISLFFNDNELQLDSIDYPSGSFNSLFEATLGDNNNDDNSDETNQRTAISFQQASLFAPYPDQKTKIATATFTVLEDFDGSEVSVKIPSPGSQSYNNAPSEAFEPKTVTLEMANTDPALTGTLAVLADGTEDTDYTLNVADLLQGFTDADGDDLSIGDLEATNGNLTDNNDGTWTFVPDSEFSGTVNLTYNVSDGRGGEIAATQSFAIASVDDAPVVANPLSDVEVDEDAPDTTIDLSTVFTDIDNDDSAITKAILSNNNDSLVNATIDGDTLTLDYLENQSGTAEIAIQGISNGLTVTDTFTVDVNEVDDAPVVANPLGDVSVDEDAPDTTINLSDVFTDIDNDDSAITKAVLSNSNDSLVNATVNGDTLTLDYLDNQSGTAEIAIQGTSNGLTVTDTLMVTVNEVDDPPFVANPLSDVAVDEDAPDTTIDLSTVFTDIDNDDSAITKAVLSNDNESLVNATINGDSLTLDYLENQSGSAEITIQGTSNGLTVTDTLMVTVNADTTDNPPTVANPLSDVVVDEDAADSNIDLSTVFTDIDNDDSAITKAVLSNSNDSLVNATINGDTLTLDYLENQSGGAEITVQGTSNGLTVTDTLMVTVNEVDDAPVVANPLSDVTVDEDAPDTTINLSNVFTDIDNDDSAITKAVLSNSNDSLVNATINGDTLTLDYLDNQSGSAEIAIQGTSNGLTVTDTLMVTVNEDDSNLGTTGRDYLTGDSDDNVLTGLAGRDILTGGGGADQFVYTSVLDGGDIIKDFEVGQDKLVFTELLDRLDYQGVNPIADGYLQFGDSENSENTDSFVMLDSDGTGSGTAKHFILVENVTASELNNSNNFIF